MTEKKLKKIEFGFENVESGEVSVDAIQDMKIVGLHQVGHRDFNDGYVSFTENLEADSFLIELDYEMANQNLTDTDEPVGERLHAYNDIVDVTLYFEDEDRFMNRKILTISVDKGEQKTMSKRLAWTIILVCSLIVIVVSLLSALGIRPQM